MQRPTSYISRGSTNLPNGIETVSTERMRISSRQLRGTLRTRWPMLPAALGWELLQARRYDEAITPLKRALELQPDFVVAHMYLAWLYEASGKGDLAIAESRRTIELGNPFGQALLADSYAVAGRKSEAAALLKEAVEQSKRSHAGAFFIAFAFDALGDKEQAFSWLEESYKEHEPLLVYLNVMPYRNDALHADPRFQDLVRRIGIPTH